MWNWEEYISLFDTVKDEKAIGESTVLYLYYYNHSIKNIKKYLGEDVKIIIMLRNPVDRYILHFIMFLEDLKNSILLKKLWKWKKID